MKSDNIFLVDFSGDKIKILHAKCGSEAVQTPASEDGIDGICFSCPASDSEAMYFEQKAWDYVLSQLKKKPNKSKMVIRKCYVVDGRYNLSSKKMLVLEKRDMSK